MRPEPSAAHVLTTNPGRDDLRDGADEVVRAGAAEFDPGDMIVFFLHGAARWSYIY